MRNVNSRVLIAVIAAALAATAAAGVAGSRARAANPIDRVDAVFAKFGGTTPGCAVGVAENGAPMLAKGYGMADLEHDVPIAPDTIFEAGSVSKQFTAAAVLLLARDGKLSLDDPVRKYVPELPDYQTIATATHDGPSPRPLTIRHMLNHTSGLRDWGSVAAIAGWPRTTRVHTHAHVLDIVSRQRALNFPPGERWSYSNTGFNLAAVIVSRVSGQPFPEFTRERIFAPLGMTHTSWRDDYTRIVKGRAIAYAERNGAYRTDMPFENVYGNGGLLTTVGDLLKWNENFTTHAVGDEAFAREQQTPGHFADGRAHGYGLGLFVGTHNGVREVSHSGSTAGYSAFLTRFPDQRLSVAVLCNVAANATQFAHAVGDAYLADRAKPAPAPKATYTLTDADLDRVSGLYRDAYTGAPLTIAKSTEGLRAARFGLLVPSSATRFSTSTGQTWEFDEQGARARDEYGTVDTFVRARPITLTERDLAAYAGTYASGEAEVEVRLAVEKGALVLKRRPDTTVALAPSYADAFTATSLGTVVFHRDASGRPDAFSVSQDRVWDLRFTRRDR